MHCRRPFSDHGVACSVGAVVAHGGRTCSLAQPGDGLVLAQPGQGGLGEVDQVGPHVAAGEGELVNGQGQVVVLAGEDGGAVAGVRAGVDPGLPEAVDFGEGEGRMGVAHRYQGVVPRIVVLVDVSDGAVEDQTFLLGNLHPAFRALEENTGAGSRDGRSLTEHGLQGLVGDARAGVVVRVGGGGGGDHRRGGGSSGGAAGPPGDRAGRQHQAHHRTPSHHPQRAPR